MPQQKPSSGDRTRFEYVARDIAELQRETKGLQDELRAISRENAALRLDLAGIKGRDEMQTQALEDLKTATKRNADTLDGVSSTLTEIKTVLATQAALEEERRQRATTSPHLAAVQGQGPPPGIQASGGWESLSGRTKSGIIAGAAGAGGVSLPYIVEALRLIFGG